MQNMNNNNIVYDDGQAGLNAFYSKIYALTGLGVAVSAVVSFITINYFAATMMKLMSGNSLIFFLLWLVPIVLMFPMQRAAMKNSPAAMPMFFGFAAIFGFMLSFTLVMYNIRAITVSFAVSAAMFIVMSLIGRTTKRDLSGMSKALMAALVGIIIAGIVNFFLQNAAIYYIISGISVIIFSGFIAWDNQKIKTIYEQNRGQVQDGWAISMALSLYLDFINLFISLLRIFGGISGRD